jgi:hypothetical protein
MDGLIKLELARVARVYTCCKSLDVLLAFCRTCRGFFHYKYAEDCGQCQDSAEYSHGSIAHLIVELAARVSGNSDSGLRGRIAYGNKRAPRALA